MSSRLDRVGDWKETIHGASFSAKVLASQLKISERQLDRYFKSHFEDSPQNFMDRLRLDEARKALAGGVSVKEVAFRLCFKQPSHFSRKFKHSFGRSPSSYADTFFARTEINGLWDENVCHGYEMSATDTRI